VGATGATGAAGSTGASGFLSTVPIVTVTANYTVNPSTDFMIFCNAAGTGSTGVTVTLPAAASNTGRMFMIKRTNPKNASQDLCKLTPLISSLGTNITVTLDPPDPTLTNINSGFWVVSDGTSWWAIPSP
jgi:hypothetical protein